MHVGRFVLLVVVSAMIAGARSTSAECVASGLCDAVACATAVIVADVEHVDAWRGLQRVRFRRVEVLKGRDRQPSTMAFTPSLDSHSFVAGQRVLLFAHRVDGEAWSTQCTPTRVLAAEGLPRRERTLIRRYARAVPEDDESSSGVGRRKPTCRELDRSSER